MVTIPEAGTVLGLRCRPSSAAWLSMLAIKLIGFGPVPLIGQERPSLPAEQFLGVVDSLASGRKTIVIPGRLCFGYANDCGLAEPPNLQSFSSWKTGLRSGVVVVGSFSPGQIRSDLRGIGCTPADDCLAVGIAAVRSQPDGTIRVSIDVLEQQVTGNGPVSITSFDLDFKHTDAGWRASSVRRTRMT